MTTDRIPAKKSAHTFDGRGLWRLLPGGTEGNARLTSLTGLLLIVLLAAEGLTILSVRDLFIPHAFIGFLLIPPVGLKLASTGYRFVSYYAGRTTYITAGPPRPFPRILAPPMVAATVLLFASGVLLVLSHPGRENPWRQVHSLSFFFWFWLMSAHVLIHIRRALSLSTESLAPRPGTFSRGALSRQAIVGVSLLLGVALAVAFLPADSTWATWLQTFRHGE